MNEPTNDHAQSPSQKAWQTAKDRAVMDYEERQRENRERGEVERHEMIKAVMDPYLSHGAARLFCFLLKAGWVKDLGGLYFDKVGAVMLDGRTLARHCGGASVNCLYQKVRREKRDAHGKILVQESVTDGWLQELVQRGYIWLGKHRIANIPRAKWPNVYNVACHVPQRLTPHLPWLDGGFGSENVINTTLAEPCSPRENTIFHASDTPGYGETPENTPARHHNGNLPVTATPTSPSPQRQQANHRTGGLPVTASDTCPSPQRQQARHRIGYLPVTEKATGQPANAVHLGESLDTKTVPRLTKEGSHPPGLAVEEAIKEGDTGFGDWCYAWQIKTPSHPTGEYRGKLVKELGRIRVKLQTDRSAFWQRRAAFLQTELDGGKPPVAKPGPARTVKPGPAKARLSDAEQDAIREKIQRGELRAALAR
jgi:hypothetical protein